MSAQLGLDYSDARPDPATMRANGVIAVGRYLGNDSRCITPTEYQTLTQHGLDVWLVKESQTTDLSVSMLNGYNKGVADALAAEAAIKQVGLPASSTVYWAADFDIAPGSTRVAQAESYVDGWNTIIPAGRRGGYGGLWFLDYLHGRGKVDALWECASTSFRHGVNPANVPLHIQQTTDTPPIVGTDYNNIFDTTSFAGNGGTPIVPKWKEADMLYIYNPIRGGGIVSPTGFYPLNPASEEAIVALATYGSPVSGSTFSDRQWDVARQTAINIGEQFAADVAARLSVPDPAKFAAAVVAALPVGTTPDTATIAKAVQSALAAQIASLPAAIVAAEGKALSNG